MYVYLNKIYPNHIYIYYNSVVSWINFTNSILSRIGLLVKVLRHYQKHSAQGIRARHICKIICQYSQTVFECEIEYEIESQRIKI